MTDAPIIVDAQVEGLLKLVDDYRQSRCREILEQAQADKTVKHAHQEARKRMRVAIEQERVRVQDKLASTRAHILTRRRQRQQQADLVLLQKAWERLHDRLTTYWQDRRQRRIWMANLMRQGLGVLPDKAWRIEHPLGWHSNEPLDLDNEIAAQLECRSPVFVESGDIAAGLRIYAERACLDGTLEGLLMDRTGIEARLLAELRRF